MRLYKSVMLLLAAVCITAVGFFMTDTCGCRYDQYTEKEVDVTSGLTGRVYALDEALTEADTVLLKDYETDLDKEIASYLKAHGGGRYTDSSGETHYISSSSGSGGYSGGSGGSYYYDDDAWYDDGGPSGGGGTYYDDGPGYTVDVYVDDTEYNICHDCGYEYIGTGRCPNTMVTI